MTQEKNLADLELVMLFRYNTKKYNPRNKETDTLDFIKIKNFSAKDILMKR